MGDESENEAIPLRRDMKARPLAYLRDMAECAAIKFSAGNMIYSAFLLLQTGLNFGTAAAALVHTALTAYTGRKQAQATHSGRNFHAPYKVTGTGNLLAAAFVAATGLHAYLTAPPKDTAPGTTETSATTNAEKHDLWSRMIFPALTFGAWGLAHFAYGASVERRRALKKEGLSDEAINEDARVRQDLRKCEVAAGVADVTAIFKDKSLHEAGRTLTDPLNPLHLNSLAGLPFFAFGFAQAVLGRDGEAKLLNVAARTATNVIPQKLRGPLHLKAQSVTPLHCYAGGYMATAAVTAASAILDPVQWVFAAASATWGAGYHDMTREKTRTPESAAEFAARTQGLKA